MKYVQEKNEAGAGCICTCLQYPKLVDAGEYVGIMHNYFYCLAFTDYKELLHVS